MIDESIGVIFCTGRFFMAAHAKRLEFNEDGPGSFAQCRRRIFHGMVNSEHIIPVDLDGVFFRNSVADGFVREVLKSELFFGRS